MLADRGSDPDVERLLEGVAFLTGRVRQKLDDEIPEVIHSIAKMLFPQLVRPIPSAAILELTPLPQALAARHVVSAGSEFLSVPIDGTECRFRSTNDCELTPWFIDDARLEEPAPGRQQLRLEIRTMTNAPAISIAPDVVRLHLSGEIETALSLLMWMHTQVDDVVLVESKPTGGYEREISLGKGALKAVGFNDEEALFPTERNEFPAFRLVEEYFIMPHKFAFVDVEGLLKIAQFDPKMSRFGLIIRFSKPWPLRLAKDMIKLHCMPVVNIFETPAEPVRFDIRRVQYVVFPAGLPLSHGDVYAIRSVQAIQKTTRNRVNVRAFYEFDHGVGMTREEGCYYATHLRPGVIGDTVDLFISVHTPADMGVLPDTDLLSIDLLATNGSLASKIRAGEICRPSASSPTVATFRNLGAATRHVPTPVGSDLQWRALAHASMGLRELTDTEVFRGVLEVYNRLGAVDRQAARANSLRVAAVDRLEVNVAERLYKGTPIRGLEIIAYVDETGFTGDGDIFLFSAIIDRFFAAYVSLNSFSVVTLRGINSNLEIKWPPRTGVLTMI